MSESARTTATARSASSLGSAASGPRRTPLDVWLAGVVGCAEPALDRATIAEWQLAQLRSTVARAQERSPFYARHLAGVRPSQIQCMEDLDTLPTMSADDLREHGQRLLCVPPSQVDRIVTMPTSGTTGPPKRVFFTSDELQHTVDFFRVGMSTFTSATDRVLVLMPGERPGSVGDLLRQAVPLIGAEVHVHGAVRDYEEALSVLLSFQPTVIVGIPIQVHGLACFVARPGLRAPGLHSVLLSADRSPSVVRRGIERAWRCRVYDHYGSTEMGFGGAVECEARDGYHLREADLLFEVVDGVSGCSLGPGETGEVVVSTLRRVAMPLVRYRTGDVGVLVAGRCACGSSLLRLAPVVARHGSGLRLAHGGWLTLNDLDEKLLGVDGVMDFSARVEGGRSGEVLRIELREVAGVCTPAGWAELARVARQAVCSVPAVAAVLASGRLEVVVNVTDACAWPVSTGMTKRMLVDEREVPYA